MAQYTIEQIQAFLDNERNTPPPGVSTWLDWNEQLKGRSLHIKYDAQLIELRDRQYPMILQELLRQYRQIIDGYIPESHESILIDQARNFARKWRDCLKEIEGRGGGYLPVRTPVGTTYYIDFNNGSDSAPHDGLKYPTAGGYYTAESGTNTTQVVDATPPRSTDDDWNGAFLWNATRQQGRKITDSAYSAGWTFTLESAITGQTSGDEYYIIDAWATPGQYSDVGSRSPGDIGYVRANQTFVAAATITFGDAGSPSSLISFIGCDSVEADPWHDGSDVKPIIDFNNANFRYYNPYGFWQHKNIQIKNSYNSTWPGGMISQVGGQSVFYRKMKINEFRYTSTGAHVVRDGIAIVEDSEYLDNGPASFAADVGGKAIFRRTKFDGGGVYGTTVGLNFYGTAGIIAEDCDFGQSSAHVNSDFSFSYQCHAFFRNCRFNKLGDAYTLNNEGMWHFEKCSMPSGWGNGDQILRRSMLIQKETSVLRSGGGPESLKVMNPPNHTQANLLCGPYNLVPIFSSSGGGGAFPINRGGVIWMKAGKRTITLYARAISAWGTPPTANELYLKGEWLSGASGGLRMSKQSTQTLSGTDWIAFSVEVNPQQEGPVYFDLWYSKYDSGGNGIYVDPTPIVS